MAEEAKDKNLTNKENKASSEDKTVFSEPKNIMTN